jgi:hypothetical protein
MIFEWVDKKYGDDIDPNDINTVAKGILELEKEVDGKAEEEYVDGKIDWVKIMNKTISADEAGVSVIYINKDIAGNPFSLKKIYINLYSPNDFEEAKYFSVYASNLMLPSKCLCYFNSNATNKYITLEAERIANDLWKTRSSHGASEYTRTFFTAYNPSEVDYITEFRISRGGMPEGTKIEVFGVKA